MLLFLESIGIGEIVLVFFFILIFFGADSLPGIARKLGRGIRQVKDMTQDIQDEITKSTMDMRREVNANRAIEEFKESLENPAHEIAKRLNEEGGEISHSLNQSVKFEKRKKQDQPETSKEEEKQETITTTQEKVTTSTPENKRAQKSQEKVEKEAK